MSVIANAPEAPIAPSAPARPRTGTRGDPFAAEDCPTPQLGHTRPSAGTNPEHFEQVLMAFAFLGATAVPARTLRGRPAIGLDFPLFVASYQEETMSAVSGRRLNVVS